MLKNTHHASNVKIYSGQSTAATEKDQDNDVEKVLPPAKRRRLSESFTPVAPLARRNLATAMGLQQAKPVYFGRSGDLTKPKRTHKTDGDGNCYFRAMSFILTGTEDYHVQLRDSVVGHMAVIDGKLKDYLNQNVNDYVATSGMCNDGVWATDAEITATANLLGVDITIYGKYGKEMRWLTYPASFSLSSTTPQAFYLEHTGNHFNGVLGVL